MRAMGAAAGLALVQQIAGSSPAHRGEYLFSPELIVRRSSGPLRVESPGGPDLVRR
jgi:DNA-binding LacI/PurR family transcriptional regulator